MSIRKRTWRTSKGIERHSWVVAYSMAGKRHIRTFRRRKDADDFEVSTKLEIRAGVHTPDSASVTVGAAAAKWIETAIGAGLERSTIARYRQHVDIHILPYLGRRKLSDLTAPMVREFEEALRKGMPAEPGLEPAPRSQALIRKVRVSLGSLLSDAQERGLVARNVVRELKAKRTRGKERRLERRQRGKLKVGIDIPTPAEAKAFLAALRGRWRPILLTAIFTGLRASELRGLRWEDVDLVRRELNVRQRADRYNALGAPKSESGERTVPLPPVVANTLREWKVNCPKSEANLVFPTTGGLIEQHTNIVARGLIPAMVAAGVTTPVVSATGTPVNDKDGHPILRAKYTGLHALRHFYASWCINRRADRGLELPPKVVQERLGHSSITMTMDVYGHLFPRDDDGSELAEAEKALLA
jgi:integrase